MITRAMKILAMLAVLIAPSLAQAHMVVSPGRWTGHMSCGTATWKMGREAANRPGWVVPMRFSIGGSSFGAESRHLDRADPRLIISETWSGSITGRTVRILAQGRASNGETWTYVFSGQLNGANQMVLEGNQYRNNNVFRRCLIRIGNPGAR